MSGVGGRAPALAAAAVLSAGAAAAVARRAGFGEVGARLAHADPVWLVPLAVAEIAAYAGYAVAYAGLTRAAATPDVGLARSAGIVTAGFGAFLPTGGFALDLRVLRRLGASRRAAREATLGLGALEYATLAPAAWAAALVLAGAPAVHRSLTLSWLVAVPAGSLAAAAAYALRSRLHPLLRRALDPLGLLGALLRRPAVAAAAYGGMALYWAGEIGSLWAGVRIFGVALSVPVAILALATGYALTRRTLPLAGAGLTEALLAYTLLWCGVGLAPALLGVVAYRIFNVWIALPAAAAAAVALERPSALR